MAFRNTILPAVCHLAAALACAVAASGFAADGAPMRGPSGWPSGDNSVTIAIVVESEPATAGWPADIYPMAPGIQTDYPPVPGHVELWEPEMRVYTSDPSRPIRRPVADQTANPVATPIESPFESPVAIPYEVPSEEPIVIEPPAHPSPADGGGLVGDLICGMIAVTPDDFQTPVKTVPLALRNVAASVLRGNRAIQVASYLPEQARAEIMTAKSVYDPAAFAGVDHSYTQAPEAIIISGAPSRIREFRNDTARAGVTQHIPSGGDLRLYREWNRGSERGPDGGADYGHGGAYVAELTQPVLNGFADMENRSVIQISRLQADISDEEFRLTVMETMSKALEAYWTVAQARENVRICEESLDMAKRLLERELGRKDEGIATQLDVNRAREAMATRSYNVDLAREQYQQAQENLKYYINDKSVPVGMDVYVDAVESLETPLVRANIEKSIDIALASRPEMRNADLAIRTSEVRRRYARHTLLPELNLVGSVRRNDNNSSTPTSGSSTLYTGTDWSVGMEFSMPIGNMKARSNVRKAESELQQKSEEKRNIRDIIITEVRTVAKSMELVVREIPLNRQAVESARKVLEGERARLELNQIGNRDLLQAQDLVSVTERNYIDSLTRYNIYIIRLFAAEGTLLEKMGIKLAGGKYW